MKSGFLSIKAAVFSTSFMFLVNEYGGMEDRKLQEPNVEGNNVKCQNLSNLENKEL